MNVIEISGNSNTLLDKLPQPNKDKQFIYIFSGPSGSGKSYVAKKFLSRFEKFVVRVNKDSLRGMLLNRWNYKAEHFIIQAEKELVKLALSDNKSVIIDDTNLTDKHINNWDIIAREYDKLTFVIVKFMPNLESCIDKDNSRSEGHVTRPVIERQFLKAKYNNWTLKNIVICDIDGTLADGTHREHLLDKNFKIWQHACDRDALREDIAEEIREFYARGWIVLIVSGRDTSIADKTISWLNLNNIPFHHIYMRNSGDNRPDEIIKLEILDQLIASGLDIDQIKLVIDDRPKVVRAWLSRGLNVQTIGDQSVEF